jgi:polysaccharide export outer membrane protein
VGLHCSTGGSALYTQAQSDASDRIKLNQNKPLRFFTGCVRGAGIRNVTEDDRMKQSNSWPASAGRRLAPGLSWAGTLAILSTMSAPSFSQAIPEYRLHPGDKVVIGVYDDPKLLPQEVTVTPDGKISYPLVGELVVGGKTVEQIRAEMEIKLKKYISDPIATVIVTDVKGNVAYVIGQVTKPGQIIMNPTINVLQALSMVGGANPYAKLDSIIVIRSTPGGQRVLSFKYSAVSAGKDLSQNVQLESGDVVVVP